LLTFGVDKRYLNHDSFAPKQDNETPQPREVDQFIMKDKDPISGYLILPAILSKDAV
jgi:hypothetical protein